MNPVGSVAGGGAALWTHLGGGLSWRPPLGRAVEGVFAIDGGWDHGFAACGTLTDEDGDGGLGIGSVSCDTWSVGVSAGASFGKQAE